MDSPRLASGARPRRRAPPLDAARLDELALGYVARFATSAGKLRAYCRRKLRERGWAGQADGVPAPDVEAIVVRFVAQGFIDDDGFARAKRGSLLRRGYGARRISQALHADGIAEEVRARLAPDEAQRREAAVAYARRRRFGPFARAVGPAPAMHERAKQLAALMRAGHDGDRARFVLDAQTAIVLEDWIAEARCQEDEPA